MCTPMCKFGLYFLQAVLTSPIARNPYLIHIKDHLPKRTDNYIMLQLDIGQAQPPGCVVLVANWLKTNVLCVFLEAIENFLPCRWFVLVPINLLILVIFQC